MIAAFIAAMAGASQAWATDSAQCKSAVPQATVEIQKVADGAIASYKFPTKISCFRLADAGKVRALTWKLLTAGAQLVDDGNTVMLAAAAYAFDVKITPFERDGQIDRVYSPVIAFGDGSAMAVYSRYLAGVEGTTLTLKFQGYAPVGSTSRVGRQSFQYRGNDTYLVVGNPQVASEGQASVVSDRAMPPWLIAYATNEVDRATAALAKRFALPGRLTYLITHTEPEKDILQWRGDTSSELVRLNFMGARWQTAGSALMADPSGFILHELFHTINHRIAPSVAGDGGLSLLEGSAEAAAHSLRHSWGDLNDAAFAAVKDAALLRCQSIPGDTLAQKEKYNTRAAPYACGEAIQHLGAALLKGQASGSDGMFSIWTPMLRGAAKQYDWSNYFATLRTLVAPAAAEQVVLLEKLVRSEVALSAVLAGLERKHVIRKLSDSEQQGEAQSAFFAQLTLNQILDAHCTGMRGTYFLDGIYTLDAPAASCTGLPDKFAVASINGHALARLGRDAYREHQRRCAAGTMATLHGPDDRVASVGCTEARANVELYSFDASTPLPQ